MSYLCSLSKDRTTFNKCLKEITARMNRTTGCPEVSDPTLIEDCAFKFKSMPKSFEPPMEEGMGIFLVYDMPLCCQNYFGSD